MNFSVSQVEGWVGGHVSRLIKMAFTASAAYVTEIRLESLVVLRGIIKVHRTCLLFLYMLMKLG